MREPSLSITWFGAAGPEGRQNALGCWTATDRCLLPSRGLHQWFSNGDPDIPEGILGKEKYKRIENMQIQKYSTSKISGDAASYTTTIIRPRFLIKSSLLMSNLLLVNV